MSSKATAIQELPVAEEAVRKASRPTEQQIAARAHELFLKRGATPGSDLDDWLQAERELTAAAKAAPSPKPLAPSRIPSANPGSRK